MEDKWILWGIVLPNTKAYSTPVIIKKHDLGKRVDTIYA